MVKRNWLVYPSLLLIANLIFRLINQSKMMFNFPLEGTDWPTHIFELWALAKYGFHSLVPNWYNGYILFQSYTPGWYFFALPFLWFTKNVLYATYLSIVALFVLIAISLYYFCKIEKLYKYDFIVFFALFMANALSISNFIRNGRVTELFGWSMFVFLIVFMFYYKDRPIDFKFILFAPLLALLILSHFIVPILFSMFLLGFFIIKSNKERIYITMTVLLGLLLSSFWWAPFITNLKQSYITELKYSTRLITLGDPITFTVSIIVPIVFLATFYLYWKSKNKPKKELLFFSPVLVFSILFALKLTYLIPLLDRIYPHPTITFFSFFIIYFIIKTDWSEYKILGKMISMFIILLICMSLCINIIHTPLVYEANSEDNYVLPTLSMIDEKYIILGITPNHFFNFALYSYGAIYYNLNSSWGGWQTTAYSNEYYNQMKVVGLAFTSKNCAALTESLLDLSTIEVLSFQDNCQLLNSCGYQELVHERDTCLYKIKQK